MKHRFSPANATALLLVCIMLLGLAGCGKTKSGDAGSAQSGSASVQKPLTGGSSGNTYEAVDPAQLRERVQQANPYASYAVAYLGHGEIEGVGRGPTTDATLANFTFISDIDDAHRIDISESAENGELFCILPTNPKNGFFVRVINPETGEGDREVYRSENGEPILLRCNGGAFPNADVCFTDEFQVEQYTPSVTVYCGQERLLEPNGGGCYDFTLYALVPVAPAVNEPGGEWKAEGLQPGGEALPITMELSLLPSGIAELVISDTASGDFMAGYSGGWVQQEEGYFSMNLTCDENCTGMGEYDGPIAGEYDYAVGEDFTLTLSPRTANSTPFYGKHAAEAIVFSPLYGNIFSGESGARICDTVLNYYDKTFNYRPGLYEIAGQEGEDVLVHLYDDMGDHLSTSGWYLINPLTLQGSDYLTEEPIDFSAWAAQ